MGWGGGLTQPLVGEGWEGKSCREGRAGEGRGEHGHRAHLWGSAVA